jgi:hypothetical protein
VRVESSRTRVESSRTRVRLVLGLPSFQRTGPALFVRVFACLFVCLFVCFIARGKSAAGGVRTGCQRRFPQAPEGCSDPLCRPPMALHHTVAVAKFKDVNSQSHLRSDPRTTTPPASLPPLSHPSSPLSLSPPRFIATKSPLYPARRDRACSRAHQQQHQFGPLRAVIDD